MTTPTPEPGPADEAVLLAAFAAQLTVVVDGVVTHAEQPTAAVADVIGELA